ncbi:hypothetical protein DdX_08752 [Ditylenchus destructor]|uniref:Uncharacterized protein n=1 Tax=Ditylenchus destructor TaxID=166010 RepID=A0AAD4R3P7_9BILA|nr:hypothetical protein DdX_08752 [Ditylenchus destructor]
MSSLRSISPLIASRSSPASQNRRPPTSIVCWWRIVFVCLLLCLCLFPASQVDARHHHHRKSKQTVDDYEYRDMTDYSDGVFVDSVPIKTTPYSSLSSTLKTTSHKETNRFPKLRKFFESQRYYYQK